MAGIGEAAAADEYHTLVDRTGYLGNRIRMSLVFLCNNSSNLSVVRTELFSSGLLSRRESQVIQNQLSDFDGFEKLFNFIIPKLGHEDYSQHFVNAFLQSGNEHILEKLKSTVVTKDFAPGSEDTSLKSIRFNVRETVSFFFGRETFLLELHEHNLQSQRTAADVPTTSTIISNISVVTGLGGIGKTETIRKYIHRYGHFYQNVVWIDAGERNTAENQFRNLALHELQLPSKDLENKTKDFDVILKDIYERLCKNHTLIVLDNAEALHDTDPQRHGVARFLPTSMPHTHFKPVVLITSRQLDWPDLHTTRLPLFTPQESSKFLFRQLKLEESDANAKDAESLFETFDGLPLALLAAAAVIREESKKNDLMGKDVYTIQNLLHDYNKGKREVLKNRPPGSPDTQPLMLLWKVSLDKIQQQPHGHLATQVLNVLAHLTPTNIPKELLTVIFKSGGEQSFVKAVALLVDYSFVHNYRKHFSIHRILQDVTLAHLQAPTEERPKEANLFLGTPPLIRITKALKEYWPTVPKSSEPYEAVQDNLVHVTMNHVLPKAEILSEKELPFIGFIEFVFEEIKQTRWVDAEKCCRVLLNYFTRGASILNFASLVELPNYKKFLHFQEQLMHILSLMGRYKEAEDIYKELLSLLSTPEDDMDVIPEILDSQMENEEPIKVNSSIIDLMSNFLGPTHKAVMAMNKLDLTPQKSGQLSEGKTFIAEMITKIEKYMGPLHPDTLSAKQTLASILEEESRSDESQKIRREMREIFEKQVVPLIVDIQSSNSCMADSLDGQKKFEELIRLFDSFTDRLEKLPEYDHHEGLVAKSNLATDLVKKGSLDEAKDMLCTLLEQQESLLGPNCFPIFVTKLKLAGVLIRQGKDEEATKFGEEAMELVTNPVGLMHSSTLKNKNVIGWMRKKIGDLENADSIAEEVLAAGQATLPTDHPSTKHKRLVLNNAEALHDSDHPRHGDLHLMSLPLWAQQDSRDFILRKLKLKESDANTKDAETLSETLGGLPLALQAATAVIFQESKRSELLGKGVYTIQHLLRDYNNEGKREVLEKRPPGSPNATPLMLLWKVALDKIRQQPHGHLATEILNVMAHLSPTNIPKELIFFIFNTNEEKSLKEAVKLLVDYSIVHNSKTHFSIHLILQDVTLAHLEVPTEENPRKGVSLLLTPPLTRITTALMEYWPTLLKSSEAYSAVHDNLVHVTMSHVLTKAQNPSETDSYLIMFTAFVLEEIQDTQWVEAEKCCRVLIACFINSSILSGSASLSDSPYFKTVVHFRRQLSSILEKMGRYKEAVDTCHELLSSFDSLEDQEDVISEILEEKHLLASILERQGEYEEAIKLNSSVIDLSSKLRGPTHSLTLATKNNLALALQNSGRLSEAKTLQAEVLKVEIKELGPLDPATLTTKHNMALILYEEGRYDDALKILRKVAEVREKELGPLHTDTLLSNNCMAYVLAKLGKDEDALQLYENLISSYEKASAASHPECLKAKYSMALTLGKQGRLDEAKEILFNVLDTQERLLGPNHVDILGTKENMAWVLMKQGKHAESLKLLEEVLEPITKQLGPTHLDTLETKYNMGCLHLKMGDFKKAERMAKEVLAARKATLPSDHPDCKDTEKLYEKARLRNNPSNQS